jgi:purine nucleoside phosphorylase
MAQAKIGIIGGSGLYKMEDALRMRKRYKVTRPWLTL